MTSSMALGLVSPAARGVGRAARARAARDLDGGHDGAGLVVALLVLGLGDAVGDEPRARLHVDRVALRDERADRDGRVEVARVRDVADGAAVEVAAERLRLLDDLHGADLGRARERAR